MTTSVPTAEWLLSRTKLALTFAEEQVRQLITKHPDYFPLFTKDGRWFHESDNWINWCDGFLGGLLWICARSTGETWWRAQAEHYSLLIKERMHDETSHDLGFLFLPTWKTWYDLTGDWEACEVVIQAGRTLAKRFNEKGRYIRSFIAPESTFVDIMMSLPLIIYAAQQSDDKALLEIGLEHCLTTRRYLIRGDGSTAHEGWFNAETGEFIKETTHQGWRPDSSWARGTAWALYGFSLVYELTKDERLLDVAQRCADFYMLKTPENGVPPNDWEEPSPPLPFESSAAAIAASGFLHLAKQATAPEKAVSYGMYARKILGTLLTPEFLAIDTPGWEGILKHAIYHQRHGLGVDESVMWGDYYFVLALEEITKQAQAAGSDPAQALNTTYV
ncbi:MAG: glycoside hydrolase family 88 protein [Verrucomicrobia bacterium]|nr:glycoside hydrolase family 88 protein [Verrucomicrobiota bacterium]